MRCIFLYNPNSGKGKVQKKLPLIQRELGKCFDEVVVCAARGAEDLERKVRASAEVFDAVIFAGGDGTFNNVLQGLNNSDVQLGYIPAGTVNDVARSLHIPRSIKGALKVIRRGYSQRLDCMSVNGANYAMYIAAAGAFTSATYTTSQSSKRAFGALAYAVEGLKHNMKLDIFRVEAECGDQKIDTHAVLVLVLNGRSVAGFPINRAGSMQDGNLEAVIIKQVRKPGFFRKIGAYFSVASVFLFGCRIKKKDGVFLRGEKIDIKTEENVVWDFDGEEGIRGNIKIEAVRGKVKMYVPKNKYI